MSENLSDSKLNSKENINEMLSLYDSGKTIDSFYNLIEEEQYRVISKEFFHIRPSHQIRYGIKPLKSNLIYHVPVLRELLITGTTFLMRTSRNNY